MLNTAAVLLPQYTDESSVFQRVAVQPGTAMCLIQYSLQGFGTAKKATLQFLETFKTKIDTTDREVLRCVAQTSLRTKIYQDLADQLTDIVVDAVLTIRKEDEPLDLYMVSSVCT